MWEELCGASDELCGDSRPRLSAVRSTASFSSKPVQ